MFEILLEDFSLSSSSPTSISLSNPSHHIFTITAPNPTTLLTTLSGPDRPLPPHSNLIAEPSALPLNNLHVDESTKTATFFIDRKIVTLDWTESIHLKIEETLSNGITRTVFETLRNRGYLLSRNGIIRYTKLVDGAIHVGMGEKGAPMDLTRRSFALSGTDAAAYDAYLSDPLYKHTPYLMTIPKPITSSDQTSPTILPSPVAVYHTTNSDGQWNIQHAVCDPWGYFTSYSQDFGGLEEFIILGDGEEGKVVGARELVKGFAELVGKPLLVPRDWLGYLASGMGLGESDDPPAQELLMSWPDLCKEHDIPCSAIHLSSGYTVDDDGNRCVFTMNKARYPDFAAMVANFHKAGIKVCPNIKPYVLSTHPAFAALKAAGALFYDPFKKDAVMTRIWSSGVGMNGQGAWVDMTHPAGVAWWRAGVKSLVELGCDAMWNDNNEYLQHNDDYECANDHEMELFNATKGSTKVGLMGRMLHTQLMGKASYDTLLAADPSRRPFVLTRSANVGTFHYAASTWSGDNYTSWKTLQGSVAMGLNAGMSLIQSYGTDVGGFAGPLPSPELFVRWVQFGCTNSRFCIHSFKPGDKDPSGVWTTNLPWMYPEVLPIIRATIKRRYAMMPYLNHLNWLSHTLAEPPNTWLGYGEFAQDPVCYSDEVLNGFDYWMGTGNLLVAGAYHDGERKKRVYFPQSHRDDRTPYLRLGSEEVYTAGQWAEVNIPLEEFAIFARAGTAIPIGKDMATVTCLDGPARIAIDGVATVLDHEGGVVSMDDWRGVEIYPAPKGSEDVMGHGEWIEDDGVSLNPEKTVVTVSYKATSEGIDVLAKFKQHRFDVAWGNTMWVNLPVGESRPVVGAAEVVTDVVGKKWFRVDVI